MNGENVELKVTKLEKRDDGVATIWLDRPGAETRGLTG